MIKNPLDYHWQIYCCINFNICQISTHGGQVGQWPTCELLLSLKVLTTPQRLNVCVSVKKHFHSRTFKPVQLSSSSTSGKTMTCVRMCTDVLSKVTPRTAETLTESTLWPYECFWDVLTLWSCDFRYSNEKGEGNYRALYSTWAVILETALIAQKKTPGRIQTTRPPQWCSLWGTKT